MTAPRTPRPNCTTRIHSNPEGLAFMVAFAEREEIAHSVDVTAGILMLYEPSPYWASLILRAWYEHA